MAGVNKAILVGRLGQDPDTKYTTDGRAVTNLSIATSETWSDKQTGEKRERTEWHRVVIFGKLAEIANQYLKKGSQVYLEGKMQTRKWQDKNGQDRWTTEVVLSGFDSVMQMLDSKGGGTASFDNNVPPQNKSTQGGQTAASSQGGGQAPAPNQPIPAPVMDDDFDDDIPF